MLPFVSFFTFQENMMMGNTIKLVMFKIVECGAMQKSQVNEKRKKMGNGMR